MVEELQPKMELGPQGLRRCSVDVARNTKKSTPKLKSRPARSHIIIFNSSSMQEVGVSGIAIAILLLPYIAVFPFIEQTLTGRSSGS